MVDKKFAFSISILLKYYVYVHTKNFALENHQSNDK